MIYWPCIRQHFSSTSFVLWCRYSFCFMLTFCTRQHCDPDKSCSMDFLITCFRTDGVAPLYYFCKVVLAHPLMVGRGCICFVIIFFLSAKFNCACDIQRTSGVFFCSVWVRITVFSTWKILRKNKTTTIIFDIETGYIQLYSKSSIWKRLSPYISDTLKKNPKTSKAYTDIKHIWDYK